MTDDAASPTGKRDRQVAAVPVRVGIDGQLQILLVTSRETKRWVVPKGWPWRDCSAHQAAAEEAREEAGIVGRIHTEPLGSFVYLKRQKSGTSAVVSVEVFQLDVVELMDTWLEMHQRTRRWFTVEEATEVVVEDGLKEIFRNLVVGLQLRRAERGGA